MIINRIKEVAEKRGLSYIRPNDDQLKQMDCSIKMWNKFFYKKSDPELNQLPTIATILGCNIQDLIIAEPLPVLIVN